MPAIGERGRKKSDNVPYFCNIEILRNPIPLLVTRSVESLAALGAEQRLAILR